MSFSTGFKFRQQGARPFVTATSGQRNDAQRPIQTEITAAVELRQRYDQLEEIGEVVDLYFSDPSGIQPKQKVLVILREHLAESERRLGELQQFRDELRTHIGHFERFLEAAGKL